MCFANFNHFDWLLFNRVAMTVPNLVESWKVFRELLQISYRFKMKCLLYDAHAVIVHHFYVLMAYVEWFSWSISSLVGGNFWIESWTKWKPQNEKINNTVYACHSQIHVRAVPRAASSFRLSLQQWMRENKQPLCKPHSLATNITSLDVKNNTSSKLPIIYYYTIRICWSVRCNLLQLTLKCVWLSMVFWQKTAKQPSRVFINAHERSADSINLVH